MPHILNLLLAEIDVVGIRKAVNGLRTERRNLIVLDSSLDSPARVGVEIRPMAEFKPSRVYGLSRLC